jgi:SHS2 domain-containing protein
MPYVFVDHIATADAAFEARGRTLGELFTAAADATLNVMVENIEDISSVECRLIDLEAEDVEMLLFELLQELIYYKDAEQLLLRLSELHVEVEGSVCRLTGQACGERIDPDRHDLVVDVKAVTLHRYRVEQTAQGWEAFVILDI